MNQIGLSFSEKAIHFAVRSNEQIDQKFAVPYPFSFNFDTLFTDEKLNQIAELINNLKQENKIAAQGISISLPMNYVHIKRVAVPLDADDLISRQQVEWEFKNYLSSPIEDYKIINSQIAFELDNYRELIFLAFKKEIITKLSTLAQICGLTLTKVIPASFIISDNLNDSLNNTNTAVFKIENNIVNTQLFLAGKYFYSYMDSVWNNEDDPEQKLFEVCRHRFSEIQNTVTQLPFAGELEQKYYVYGDGFSKTLEKIFVENFSVPVEKLVVKEQEVSDSGLESVQILVE